MKNLCWCALMIMVAGCRLGAGPSREKVDAWRVELVRKTEEAQKLLDQLCTTSSHAKEASRNALLDSEEGECAEVCGEAKEATAAAKRAVSLAAELAALRVEGTAELADNEQTLKGIQEEGLPELRHANEAIEIARGAAAACKCK